MNKEKTKKRIQWFVWGMMLILLLVSDLYAAEKNIEEAPKENHQVQLGLEYLYPTDDDRNITTYNLNAYYLIKIKNPIIPRLSFYAGLTATYATGDITQLEGELSEGTLREVKYDNEAIGIGPNILADLRLGGINKINFHLDGSGSIILYNKDFPSGGEQYNFM
jgi:hypothetical protein